METGFAGTTISLKKPLAMALRPTGRMQQRNNWNSSAVGVPERRCRAQLATVIEHTHLDKALFTVCFGKNCERFLADSGGTQPVQLLFLIQQEIQEYQQQKNASKYSYFVMVVN